MKFNIKNRQVEEMDAFEAFVIVQCYKQTENGKKYYELAKKRLAEEQIFIDSKEQDE